MDELDKTVGAALQPFEGIRAAWLFGSQAAGRARPDSDLDLALSFESSIDADARETLRRQITVALTDALGPLGERADLVDLDDSYSSVAFRAVSEGRLVLARTEADRVRAVVRVARRYDDDGPRRELFRRAAIAAAERMGSRDGRR